MNVGYYVVMPAVHSMHYNVLRLCWGQKKWLVAMSEKTPSWSFACTKITLLCYPSIHRPLPLETICNVLMVLLVTMCLCVRVVCIVGLHLAVISPSCKGIIRASPRLLGARSRMWFAPLPHIVRNKMSCWCELSCMRTFSHYLLSKPFCQQRESTVCRCLCDGVAVCNFP